MYTGGWEVVGRNKKDKNVVGNKTNKPSKAEKKKFIENAPKLEDFLPLDQVKNLYDNLDGNKENKKPAKEKESKTKENEEKKKQQKIEKQQVEKKKEEIPREKPPKSIEEALNSINVVDVQNLIASNQADFPDAPLVWLKTLGGFLNSKIPVDKDDPIFSGRPDGYPLNVVPKSLRVVLEKAIHNAGALNARLFYEFVLTAMAMEMSKGTPVVGYKIFIQLLAKYDPKLSVCNLPKLVSMRNSYQNRKPIGLSLLWSFTQGGRENFTVGLKIWHEVMAPMLEARSYSNHVMQILHDLILWHIDEDYLQPDLYFDIFDDFFLGKYNISQAVMGEAIPLLQKLRVILFQNKSINHRKIFDALLAKANIKMPQNHNDEVVEAIISCFKADERCFSMWKSQHMKYLYVSSALLTYIDSNWSSLQESLNRILLQEVLAGFKSSYERSKKGKGKDDRYLHTCNNMCNDIMKKMSSKKSTKGGFPWKKTFILFLAVAGAIVAYDTHKHGSFEATSTGKFMRDSGITAYALKTWTSTKLYYGQSLEYLEATSPEYYKAVVDFSKPYVELAGNGYLIVKNVSIRLYTNAYSYVAAKTPLVVATVEEYVPGLMESVQKNSVQIVEMAKTYSALIAEQAIENSVKATRWLKTNVFVGKLSPESLQNYANQAIETTQTFASQTYDWVYQKVQTLSKVQ
ncbi:hypothetical protein QAD02_024417 [Eretmocerus hayati]|uniref:Uncharacterized protein n=1 Tax=Eretmocerus hayati TaxID=131215 RepID=A0ACC2PZ06_9HYME|nr:hypothetical protein QAD02_024417 [Eretmocerus hayati]